MQSAFLHAWALQDFVLVVVFSAANATENSEAVDKAVNNAATANVDFFIRIFPRLVLKKSFAMNGMLAKKPRFFFSFNY